MTGFVGQSYRFVGGYLIYPCIRSIGVGNVAQIGSCCRSGNGSSGRSGSRNRSGYRSIRVITVIHYFTAFHIQLIGISAQRAAVGFGATNGSYGSGGSAVVGNGNIVGTFS